MPPRRTGARRDVPKDAAPSVEIGLGAGRGSRRVAIGFGSGTLATVVSEKRVSLVIPGRDCASTVGDCLDAVVPLLGDGPLGEIIFVDDGSVDETIAVVERYPVTLLRGQGLGAGAARNIGLKVARYDLIWFVDSDCVAGPDALDKLLPYMDDPIVGGVGGSYANRVPDSLLGCLIHEEIVERHLAMPARVNFLATFNVLYRKTVLEAIGGFDQRYLKGQDAELSFRVMEAGYELRFTRASCVAHFHEMRWLHYLRIQRQQGFWRVRLHLSHSGHAMGDSYSSAIDHAQPPLAMLSLVGLGLLFVPGARWCSLVAPILLVAAQVPMTSRLVKRLGSTKYLAYAWMSFVRSFWRGTGMAQGVIACVKELLAGKTAQPDGSADASIEKEGD